MLTIIAAMTAGGLIGDGDKLPWHLPEDLKEFKRITSGGIVLMGRKTYESILGYLGKPLPGRENLVLSRTLTDDRVSVLRDIDDLPQGDVFVIGGAGVYEALLPRCEKMILSLVEGEYTGDTYFPEVNWDEWELVAETEFEGFMQKTFRRVTL